MSTITVIHYNPQTGAYDHREYSLPEMPGATVLQALQFIYEELDPTIAFRYGCRYKRCGLCGVMIDGKPRLACKVKLEGVQVIAPLASLPLLRGLAVDRSAYMEKIQGLGLFPQGEGTEPLGELIEDPLHANLMHCVECLCCVASCPHCSEPGNHFAGPYTFVKLAQLHLDPRDATDRAGQARALGIEKCQNCRQCACPNGIKLHQALLALQGCRVGGEE